MDIRQSQSFKIKKWTLFGFCGVAIVGSIIMAGVASSVIDSYVNSHYHAGGIYTQSEIDAIKSASKAIIYVVVVFTILFQLLGLMGAYKEHYCMTMTYAILMTLGALGSISSAIRAPTFWVQTILDFAICGVAYSFLYDLRQIRRQMFATPVYINGPGPHTTVVHMPGPSTGAPYNGQQYGQQPTGNWAPPPPPYGGNEQKFA